MHHCRLWKLLVVRPTAGARQLAHWLFAYKEETGLRKNLAHVSRPVDLIITLRAVTWAVSHSRSGP
eukprot:695747-Heterocapsa_arctica.AAC.1